MKLYVQHGRVCRHPVLHRYIYSWHSSYENLRSHHIAITEERERGITVRVPSLSHLRKAAERATCMCGVCVISNFLRSKKTLRSVCTLMEILCTDMLWPIMEHMCTLTTCSEGTSVDSKNSENLLRKKKQLKCQLKYTVLSLWYHGTQNTKKLCVCFNVVGNNLSSLTSTTQMFLHAGRKSNCLRKKKTSERNKTARSCSQPPVKRHSPSTIRLYRLNKNYLKDKKYE